MKRTHLTALLLLAPTLILTGWSLWLPISRADGPALRIRLQGYDPRDLLRGHYLMAGLDIDGLPPGRYGPDDCICLTAPSAQPGRPGFTPLPACTTDVLASCPMPLTDPGRVLQIYQSKETAKALERLLADDRHMVDIEVRFDGTGGIALDDIRVDGKPPVP